jgi:hypothetical protein
MTPQQREIGLWLGELTPRCRTCLIAHLQLLEGLHRLFELLNDVPILCRRQRELEALAASHGMVWV